MRLLTLIISALLMNSLLCAQAAQARAASIAEGSLAAKHLTEKLLKIKTLTTYFQQAVTQDKQVIQRSSGQLILMRPAMWRWQIDKPNPQLIIADGKRLWIYDKDLEQVTVKNQKQDFESGPVFFLGHITEKNVNKAYSVVQRGNVFYLMPRDNQRGYQQIEMSFVEGGRLQRMQLTDGLAQKTTLIFTRTKINTHIDAKLFQFHVPHNVDVVSE